MSLVKKFLKTRPVCKVTFSLPVEAARSAKNVHLVGDFNGWDQAATPMKKGRNGDFKVTLDLETDREYQFRYLIDGRTWENDWNADRYVMSTAGFSENSVVAV